MEEKRYIDADALKQDIVASSPFEYGWNVDMEVDEILELVDDQPTADVEEVRHGEWILLGCSDDDWNLLRFKCSICGREIHEHKNYDQPLKIKYPYCHCGARMNGGKE